MPVYVQVCACTFPFINLVHAWARMQHTHLRMTACEPVAARARWRTLTLGRGVQGGERML